MEPNGQAQVNGVCPCLRLLSFTCLTLFPWYWDAVLGLGISSPLVVFWIPNLYLRLFISRASNRETQLFVCCLSVHAWWLEQGSWDLVAHLCYFQLPTTCEWQFCASNDANIFSSLLTPLFLSYLPPANSIGSTVKAHHFSPVSYCHPGLTHHHLCMFPQWPLA